MKIIDSVIEAYSYHFSSFMEELAVPGAIFLNEIVVHCSEQSSILVKHLKSWSCRAYRLVAKQVPQVLENTGKGGYLAGMHVDQVGSLLSCCESIEPIFGVDEVIFPALLDPDYVFFESLILIIFCFF